MSGIPYTCILHIAYTIPHTIYHTLSTTKHIPYTIYDRLCTIYHIPYTIPYTRYHLQYTISRSLLTETTDTSTAEPWLLWLMYSHVMLERGHVTALTKAFISQTIQAEPQLPPLHLVIIPTWMLSCLSILARISLLTTFYLAFCTGY